MRLSHWFCDLAARFIPLRDGAKTRACLSRAVSKGLGEAVGFSLRSSLVCLVSSRLQDRLDADAVPQGGSPLGGAGFRFGPWAGRLQAYA